MESELFGILHALNAPTAAERLGALKQLAPSLKSTQTDTNKHFEDVNNHIHTSYSFSPYSPSAAAYMAKAAGLSTAGIMDHDSVSGACEFIEAGKILALPVTVGAEIRASMKDTPLEKLRINNPDQNGIAYMGIHGIPHNRLSQVSEYLAPYREKRNIRNRRMTERLNSLTEKLGVTLDFDADVLPLSLAEEGGSVTERHLLFALSKKLIKRYEGAQALISALENGLSLPVSAKAGEYLSDADNPNAAYDLLNVLKSHLVKAFYIDANDECPPVREALAFIRDIGAISAYAYLGDVTASVTGDKRAQEFEDSYLPELFETLHTLGFDAVTYMPSRNSEKQLSAVRAYCDSYGLFQICGEDINQPRQKFVCEKLREPEFHNLIQAAWALIGHELAASDNPDDGFFSENTVALYPRLTERTAYYASLAKNKVGEKNVCS